MRERLPSPFPDEEAEAEGVLPSQGPVARRLQSQCSTSGPSDFKASVFLLN